MTRRGVVYGICFALLSLAAFSTGRREIFLAVFILGMVGFVMLVSALVCAATVRTQQQLDGVMAIRGQSGQLLIRLEARPVLPVLVQLAVLTPACPVHPVSGQRQPPEYVLTLFPWSRRQQLCVPLAYPHRGEWPVGVERLYIHDVLGLFRFRPLRRGAIRLPAETLAVYPCLIELDGEVPPARMSMEYSETQVVTADYGDSFTGTRLYRDGDPLKRIHWKQTVRTRELYTRQYDMSTEQYNLLVLDTGVPGGPGYLSYADMLCESAAAMGLAYIHGGQTVRLLCADGTDLTAVGVESFWDVYGVLAAIPFAVNGVAPDLEAVSADSLGQLRSVHIFTARPQAETLERLRIFAQRQCRVGCIAPSTAATQALRETAEQLEVSLAVIACPQDILRLLGECL